MSSYPDLVQAVLEGNHERSAALAQKALEQDASPEDIVESGLQAAMAEVGKKYTDGEYFVPDMLYSARAVNKAMDVLRPRLTESGGATLGKVVLGTVSGDIHDIGKNLVVMFVQGAGFEVIDLGTDVSAEQFVAAVEEHSPDILGMSALLTTTMNGMGKTVAALEQAELRHRVKIVIGGAPVTQHFADHIGADGYAADGGMAIELCRKLVGR